MVDACFRAALTLQTTPSLAKKAASHRSRDFGEVAPLEQGRTIYNLCSDVGQQRAQ